MNAHNLPIASSDTSPSSMHREAARGSDAATLYLDDAMLGDVLPFPVDAAIEQRLRADSPKSGARHVRIHDDPMIGENMWASDEPRVHWTTYPLTIAGVCVALIFVLQLCRAYLGAVL